MQYFGLDVDGRANDSHPASDVLSTQRLSNPLTVEVRRSRGKDVGKAVITPKSFRTPLDLYSKQTPKWNSVKPEFGGRAKAIVLLHNQGMSSKKPARIELYWTQDLDRSFDFRVDAEALFARLENRNTRNLGGAGGADDDNNNNNSVQVAPVYLHPLDWLEQVVRRRNYGLVPPGSLADVVTPYIETTKNQEQRETALDYFIGQNDGMSIAIRLPKGAAPVTTQMAGVLFSAGSGQLITAMLTSNNQLFRFRVVSSTFASARDRKVALARIRDVEVLYERPTEELEFYRNTSTAPRSRETIAAERMDFKNAPLANL